MNVRIRIGALATGASLIFTVAACGTNNTATANNPASNTQQNAGGRGESMAMTTSSPMSPQTSAAAGSSMSVAASGPHNAADITFVQMMTVHHQGAIAMADLAPTRAASGKVKELAAKIKAEQAPEITEMSSWLDTWTGMAGMTGMSSSAMGGMSGMASGGAAASMPGMMSGAQMDQLTAATGGAFDKMFLQLMITHHQGALTMAKTEKASGKNTAALALADSITSSQTAEITQMQGLLKGL